LTLALSAHQTRRLRLKAQRLYPGSQADAPALVLQDVVGVQAQDLPAARLAMRARGAGLTAAGVEQARQVERSIVWTWCLRGTLHLVSREDARWLVPFLGPALIAGDRRRLLQLGWDEGKVLSGMELLQEALSEQGSLTRPEIIRLFKAHGLPWEGQAPVHLLYRAALECVLCPGPDRGKQPAYVPFESWIGKPEQLPRQEALERIARRYLEAYGPTGPQDLAGWSGLKPGEARQAFDLIRDELLPVEAAGQPAWLLEYHLPWLDELPGDGPAVSLLPRFDTYLLGYTNRDLVVKLAYARRVHPGGGIIKSVLLVDGEARGTWTITRRNRRLEIAIEPFEPLSEQLLPSIEWQIADLGRFLGETAIFIKTPPSK
jgi:hypothetical protein